MQVGGTGLFPQKLAIQGETAQRSTGPGHRTKTMGGGKTKEREFVLVHATGTYKGTERGESAIVRKGDRWLQQDPAQQQQKGRRQYVG